MVGYNPFQLKTIAGEIPVFRGVQKKLEEKLNTISAESEAEDVVYIIIPSLPAQKGVQEELEKKGAKVIRAMSANAYVVKSSVGIINQMANEPLVYWIGQVPWDKKIDPVLARELNIKGARQIESIDESLIELGIAIIVLYDREDKEKVQSVIESFGVQIERFDDMIGAFRCSGIDEDSVTEIARMQEVSFIEAPKIERSALETSVNLCNHEYIRDDYSFESDIVVGMIDSGLQLNHFAFSEQSGYAALTVKAWETLSQWPFYEIVDPFQDNPSGHGSHVAGIILSRWKGLNIDGMAPRTGGDTDHAFRVVRCGSNIYSPNAICNTDVAMQYLSDDNAALVINNSWGSDDNTGTNSSSHKADTIVWEKGQIYVFAAGNDGPAEGSINSPAAAKNIIAVGNINNGTLTLELSSSEGPTYDGRKKPDIYAPGSPITSVDSSNLNGFIEKGGTSMSAPHVTGFLATLLGHYPDLKRHPATAKAVLMASAARKSWLSDHTGVLNSEDAHFATSTTCLIWGQHDNPAGFESVYWDVDNLPSGMTEMYIVLTWIEPPSDVGAATAVLNDIDLCVDHNNDNECDWTSVSYNDNVEFVKIIDPPSGNYCIKATRYSSTTNYKLGFALFYRTSLTQTGQLQFSLAGYSVNEDSGTATIEVTRTDGNDGVVSVAYSTSAGSAASGLDYNEASGVVNWADGDSASKTFTVTIIDDLLNENDETVNLVLSNPTGGASLGNQNQAVLTIVDNDPPPVPGHLQFSLAEYSVNEDSGIATIEVTRTDGSSGPVSVTYSTSAGSATSGLDYNEASGVVSWADGDSASKTFTVTIIDDLLNENDETVNLALSNPTGGASLGSLSTATLTIIDKISMMGDFDGDGDVDSADLAIFANNFGRTSE